ncbi:hypothetical protein HWI79_3149 [Cryptosporidium felis]|nr:hypothetical protein HWI79_3149 [Cryptosporidium felis]
MKVRKKYFLPLCMIVIALMQIFRTSLTAEQVDVSDSSLANEHSSFQVGEELIESNNQFPTLDSFFSWIHSFNNLYSNLQENFEESIGYIPLSAECQLHSILINSISESLQCLELMESIYSTYKSSLDEAISQSYSEASNLNVVDLLVGCLLPLKKKLLRSYINTQAISFDLEEFSTPLLQKVLSTLIDLYYEFWNIIITTSGYKSFIEKSAEKTAQNLHQLELSHLEINQGASADQVKQLESNIITKKLEDQNRLLNLLNLILSILSGDYSKSIEEKELESLIVEKNKVCIKELEESKKILESASKKANNQETEGINKILIEMINKETNERTEQLMTQLGGNLIYLSKYDSELTELLARFDESSSESEDGDKYSVSDQQDGRKSGKSKKKTLKKFKQT